MYKDIKASKEIRKFDELYQAQLSIESTDNEEIVKYYWDKAVNSYNENNYQQALIELLMSATKISAETPWDIQDSVSMLYWDLKSFKSLYQGGLNHFYNCDFNEAKDSFLAIYNLRPEDSLTLFYAKACGDFTNDDMVLVEGGSFVMGKNGSQFASPEHRVSLSDFHISKYEVTNAQYARFLNEYVKDRTSGGNNIDSIDFFVNWNGVEGLKIEDGNIKVVFGYENRPAAWITWYGAKAFCDFYGLSLPTEAQWEFAARGGNKSEGYTYAGSYYIDEVADYFGNNGISTSTVTDNKPNELGLHNMSGNLWEWCQDWYDTYSSLPQTNPSGPIDGVQKVCRGGSWNDEEVFCRVYSRYSWHPTPAGYFMGFRVALNP